jgi:capsular exopolysaccharide synthesis family protein
MNNDNNDYFDFMEDENPVQIKQLIGKYLAYWPFFLGSVLVCLFTAAIYLRYADVVYNTEAKVKLLSDKESSNFSLDVSKLFNKSNVNLENEIALFKSARLAEQVVRNLKLNVNYYFNGSVSTNQIYDAPFVVTYIDTLTPLKSSLEYSITITKNGYTVMDMVSGKTKVIRGYAMDGTMPSFPITIQPSLPNVMDSNIDKNYTVVINPISKAAVQLSAAIAIEADGKDSDILSLSLQGTDGTHSEQIIDNLIAVFDADGVSDKQEVSRRTISFVEERFVYLRRELDSIETSKKEYKRNNDLSLIQEDVSSNILDKSFKEKALYDIESQLLLAKLLKENVNSQKAFGLLPANIGIQNSALNDIVGQYNTSILAYQKLQTSAGVNNPSLQSVVTTLTSQKANIVSSVNSYTRQLQTSLGQSELAQRATENSFSSIPEKEKVLRSIERQQNLKESLYLLLLQKREEASINLAVTVPNTKIIDYAITNDAPVSPQRKKIFLIAFFLGLLVPFGVLYLIFMLDNKIHSANDVEATNNKIPILAEIPSLNDTKDSQTQNREAFQTLANNTNFITPYSDQSVGKVIFVTSSIKNEGKTFVSYNLATAYANLDKKVLLVGADFRNPQLHKYIHQNQNETKGFSNYLHDGALNWEQLLYHVGEVEYPFDILLSGTIPPNPTLLLSNSRFDSFVKEAKQHYDIVIFDTPPTLLVTDTLIISKYADTNLFVLRSGVSENNFVNYSSKLSLDKKINNMGYVINDVNFKSTYGYGYGYNYGYGYGYGKDPDSKSWYEKSVLGKLFTKKS